MKAQNSSLRSIVDVNNVLIKRLGFIFITKNVAQHLFIYSRN